MLGKNIKELRIEKGLSQAELAKEIGVTQGAVYFWEKEINEPTAGYLIKLAKFFGTTVDELLAFECEKNEDCGTKLSEMAGLFQKLTESQQDLMIEWTKELIGSNKNK